MIGAIIIEDIVENLIVLDEAQIPELSAALNCEIVDARPYGLAIGDLRTDAGWTRNAGGEQMILPLLEQESYDSYSVAAAENIELKEQNAALIEQVEAVADTTAEEALAILSGEVEA